VAVVRAAGVVERGKKGSAGGVLDGRCAAACAMLEQVLSRGIIRITALKARHVEIKVNTDVVLTRKIPVFSRKAWFCRGTTMKKLCLDQYLSK